MSTPMQLSLFADDVRAGVRRGRAGPRRTPHLLLALLLVVAVMPIVGASAEHTDVSFAHLGAVGPVSPEHGFPVWYEDKGIPAGALDAFPDGRDPLALELCLDTNGMCLLEDDVDLGQPVSFPDNFGEEAFWWTGEAEIESGDVEVLLVLALEAAFALEEPIDGDQISFGRVRIRAWGLEPGGEYTFTHPYGVDVHEAEEPGGGGRNINVTEDIGVEEPFTGALRSRIGPFLTWPGFEADDALLVDGKRYVGDPNVEHEVVGSPYDTDFLRIEGPGIPEDEEFACPEEVIAELGDGIGCLQTDLFAISGKVATNFGVGPDGAFVTDDGDNDPTIDVFATTRPGKELTVSGSGFSSTPMANDGDRYFARVTVTDGVPDTVTVTNWSDDPPAVVVHPVTDRVAVLQADYDTESGELTVAATTSITGEDVPTLHAVGYGPLGPPGEGSADHTGTFETSAPVPHLTVRSARGGQATATVVVDGPVTDPVPISANAGPDQTVVPGATVTLDGSGSTGTIDTYSWTQASGDPAVDDFENPNQAVATFTAPLVEETVELTFELTVTGPDGSDTDTVTITVDPVDPEDLAAVAGPDQEDVALGATVTLDGSGSVGAATYLWELDTWMPSDPDAAVPTISLTDPEAVTTSFTFPTVPGTLTFQLTVTASDETTTSTDTVTISSAPDVIVVEQAMYRTNSQRWEVRGTAELPGNAPYGNRVTIELLPTDAEDAEGDPVFLAEVAVEATGEWRFRARGTGIAAEDGDELRITSRYAASETVLVHVRN